MSDASLATWNKNTSFIIAVHINAAWQTQQRFWIYWKPPGVCAMITQLNTSSNIIWQTLLSNKLLFILPDPHVDPIKDHRYLWEDSQWRRAAFVYRRPLIASRQCAPPIADNEVNLYQPRWFPSRWYQSLLGWMAKLGRTTRFTPLKLKINRVQPEI